MTDSAELLDALVRANQVALNCDWHLLTSQTLELLAEICQAEAALLCWSNLMTEEQAWWGCLENQPVEVCAALREYLAAQKVFKGTQAQWFDRTALEEILAALPAGSVPVDNILSLPLARLGVEEPERMRRILLINVGDRKIELAELIARRMASELDRADQLERERQIKEFDQVYHEQGASLDPERVLRRLMDRARKMLQVERVSLWLVDEAEGSNVLWMVSPVEHGEQVEQIHVPPGKGLIGYVIQTGEPVVVQDAYSDPRFYRMVDSSSGFTTHSLLTVSLVARSVDLGQERGIYSERIIDGLQAINKINGSFLPDDVALLQEMSNRAATEMVVANLWRESNKLFEDFIEALVDALDERDKRNPGHSRRVSKYSLEIGAEIGLAPEEMYHLRIGSLLHDIGKIGISDAILNKKGKLGLRQWKKMKQHPEIGERIIRKVHQLSKENSHDVERSRNHQDGAQRLGNELAAIAEHHEKMNGSGYPRAMTGSQISVIGRIVSVADVFDALTSNRPYHTPMSVDEALDLLVENSGDHFETAYVNALIQAYHKGRITPQTQQR